MSESETNNCFFVSDLHGRYDWYEKLFKSMLDGPPAAVFMGGDILPHDLTPLEIDGVVCRDFLKDYLVPKFNSLRRILKDRYPSVFLILGNDDPRSWEGAFLSAASDGVWECLHGRKTTYKGHPLFGYSHVPPTPFLQKDWEKYDVSRYVDPGSIGPEKGLRSVPVSKREIRNATIQEDLQRLAGSADLKDAIFLFHSPPYKTKLDRAALDGKMVDHVPLDVHVGSIAIRKFIESRQPYLTLHGHVHESSSLTGMWRDRIGRTHLLSAAYDGPELALVTFDLEDPSRAARLLL